MKPKEPCVFRVACWFASLEAAVVTCAAASGHAGWAVLHTLAYASLVAMAWVAYRRGRA